MLHSVRFLNGLGSHPGPFLFEPSSVRWILSDLDFLNYLFQQEYMTPTDCSNSLDVLQNLSDKKAHVRLHGFQHDIILLSLKDNDVSKIQVRIWIPNEIYHNIL